MDTVTLPAAAASATAKRQTQTLILLNANAGGGRAARIGRAIGSCIEALPEGPMLFVSDDVSDACSRVEALPPGSRVIVCGGDGSIGRLLIPLVAGGHSLGIVPVGSGNDAARALGVAGMDWRRALDHALTALPEPADLGEISWIDAKGGEQRSLFISSACVGFDATVVDLARSLPAAIVGMPRYALATLMALGDLQNHDISVLTDGRALRAGPVLLASALNTPTYGGGMPIAPDAAIDDGALDLMMAEGMGLWRALGLLARMLGGRHLGEPGVIHRRFRQLVMKADVPVPLAADGEYLGLAREISVQLRAVALPVLRAPAS